MSCQPTLDCESDKCYMTNMTDDQILKKRQNQMHYRLRNLETGLCAHCAHPTIPGLTLCEIHRQKAKQYQRTKRRNQYVHIKGPYKCGRCGGLGHNRTTCTEGEPG